MPKYLGMLEKLLVSNRGGDGYFVGNKVLIIQWFFFLDSSITTTERNVSIYKFLDRKKKTRNDFFYNSQYQQFRTLPTTLSDDSSSVLLKCDIVN